MIYRILQRFCDEAASRTVLTGMVIAHQTFGDMLQCCSEHPGINHFLRVRRVLQAELSDYTDLLFNRIVEILSDLPQR